MATLKLTAVAKILQRFVRKKAVSFLFQQ